MTANELVASLLREQAANSRLMGRTAEAMRLEAKADEYGGRRASCSECPRMAVSSSGLARFQDRGPGSQYAAETCRCGFFRVAHKGQVHPITRELKDADPKSCPGFEPKVMPTDSYYCGCEGWD